MFPSFAAGTAINLFFLLKQGGVRHTSSFCHKVVEELFEKLRAWERMRALAEEPQGMVPSFAAGAMADIFRMLISRFHPDKGCQRACTVKPVASVFAWSSLDVR